jgi:hypothetical protein
VFNNRLDMCGVAWKKYVGEKLVGIIKTVGLSSNSLIDVGCWDGRRSHFGR